MQIVFVSVFFFYFNRIPNCQLQWKIARMDFVFFFLWFLNWDNGFWMAIFCQSKNRTWHNTTQTQMQKHRGGLGWVGVYNNNNNTRTFSAIRSHHTRICWIHSNRLGRRLYFFEYLNRFMQSTERRIANMAWPNISVGAAQMVGGTARGTCAHSIDRRFRAWSHPVLLRRKQIRPTAFWVK